MKRIRITELIAEIKANIVAFFSVAMFVGLGIGLFLGIQWGAEALKKAGNEVFEAGKLHDIEISFPYGLTEDNLAELQKIDGVTTVEPGYSAFAMMEQDTTSFVLKLQGLVDTVGTPTVVDGEMPKRAGEGAILAYWAEAHNVHVGDTITLRHDANGNIMDLSLLNQDISIDTGVEDINSNSNSNSSTSSDAISDKEEDPDGMAYLTTDTFVVTALVDSPAYLTKTDGTIGIANVGSGRIDCVMYVVNDSFDTAKFDGSYPTVYLRCEPLEGANTFGEQYEGEIDRILSAVDELGKKLGDERYTTLQEQAQQKIDEGAQQLSDGEQKIEDAEQQLADARTALEKARQTLASAKRDGAAQLQDAYNKLVSAQQTYDNARAMFNDAVACFAGVKDQYNDLINRFNDVRSHRDAMDAAYASYQGAAAAYKTAAENAAQVAANPEATEEQKAQAQAEADALWAPVRDSYNDYRSHYDVVSQDYDAMVADAQAIDQTTGYGFTQLVEAMRDGKPSLDALAEPPVEENYNSTIPAQMGAIQYQMSSLPEIDTNAEIPVEISGYGTVYINLSNPDATINQVAGELDAKKAELDYNWGQYYAAKAEYDRQIANGQAQINSGEAKIENGQSQLDEGHAKLEDGRARLAEAREQLANMNKYEWIVLSRLENGSVASMRTITFMMGNVRWAMALLFVLVGLFVCYSAVSRLVHEQIVQIGTKKAVGFREGEIASLYLLFSALAVLLGIVLAAIIAVFLVQSIMNPTAAQQFAIPAYPPYFSITDLLIGGVIEMVLILLSTWFAIHGMLKRNAIALLTGESTANVKPHFYEKWGVWQKMSLYSQTIVNNCVNDPRRVVGTLVGVVGCTALIVTAVTLYGNVTQSIKIQYQDVYNYDSLIYLRSDVDGAAESVGAVLEDQGVQSALARVEYLQGRDSTGHRTSVSIVVPHGDDFDKLYHVISSGSETLDLPTEGIFVSAGYAEHEGIQVGDTVVLTEADGANRGFIVAGVFDYYLLRHEFVVSPEAYEAVFEREAEPNVYLANTDGANLDELRSTLESKAEGYDTLFDDRTASTKAFNDLADLLTTVVLVYLLLSGMMAVMVLLNLDVMFVSEKKRELITLMICGFSVKDAKAYIYRDSIALTVIGIILGIVLGAVMGDVTVGALEPAMGHFVKGFNWMAAGVGALGAGVFAIAVLLWSLRAIPRFDLTDINRF